MSIYANTRQEIHYKNLLWVGAFLWPMCIERKVFLLNYIQFMMMMQHRIKAFELVLYCSNLEKKGELGKRGG